jgi:acyl-[acyl-carrier-protein]-phospholipid O-acyltransferase/long-chain-fatty-acid--[acyl-carrier-protein] ligase
VPELAIPRKMEVVATLPLLGSGKANYVVLKRMAEVL